MWPASPSRNRRPSLRLLGFPPMHLEIGDPAQIAQARIGADAGVDRRAELGRCRRIVARVSWVAARENEPATVRQRREQDEACGADDDAGGLGRNGEAKLDVRHHVLSAVRLAIEMLPHGMARDAMSSAGAQQVARLADLGSAAHVERNAESLRTSVDRSDLDAIFDGDAVPRQMIAEDLLSPPLRLAALKFVAAAEAGEVRTYDWAHARAKELAVLDVHAAANERLDQVGPVDDVEHRRLERGSARLVVRRKPSLNDARFDAVTHQFAGREQSGRTASDDQEGRLSEGFSHFEGNRAAWPV